MTMSRRIRKTILAVATALAVVTAGAGIAYAANDLSIINGRTNHTVYKAAREINITGTVNGDIFCGAQTVTIDAIVNGDVICAGQTVTVNGTVHGNIRIAAQTATIGAAVDRNASVTSQSFTLQDNAKLGGDLGVAGQTITLDGLVGRDLEAAGQNLSLSGPVGRNVTAHVEKLTLQSDAKVAGSLTYTSPNQLKKASGSQVAGRVTYHKSEAKKQNHHWFAWLQGYLLIAKLVIALVLVALFPQLFRRWNVVSRTRYGAALLTGFVAMFAVPIIILISMATVIGIPLGIFLLLAWAVAVCISMVLAMYMVGSLIIPKLHPLLIVLVGGLVLGLLEMLPYVGFLVVVVAYWLGTGSFLLNMKNAYKKPDYSRP